MKRLPILHLVGAIASELRFAFSPILSIWNIRENPDENSCASPRDRVSVIGSSPIPLPEAWKPVTKVESFLKTEQTFSLTTSRRLTFYLRIIMRYVYAYNLMHPSQKSVRNMEIATNDRASSSLFQEKNFEFLNPPLRFNPHQSNHYELIIDRRLH